MEDLLQPGPARLRRTHAGNRDLQERTHHQVSHSRVEFAAIRTATLADIPFIDSLQKAFSNNVGFLPRPALFDYITRRCVLIATANAQPVAYILGRDALHWQPLLRPVYQLCVQPIAQGHYFAVQLLTAWQNLAKLAGQIGLQANCAAHIPAHTFWASQGYRFVCHLPTTNARQRDIICWRKALIEKVPRWFIDPPKRAGYRGKKTGELAP